MLDTENLRLEIRESRKFEIRDWRLET
jgi:hypothetical protein